MRITCAVVALTLASGAARASDLPAGGLTIDEVSAWLQRQGYAPERVADTNGGAHLRIVDSGVKVGVYMYDCNGADRCGSLQFSAGWATHGKFDVTQINRWNRDKRWCRGYFDAENDPWVERDADLSPGTWELLGDELRVFKHCVSSFEQMYSL